MPKLTIFILSFSSFFFTSRLVEAQPFARVPLGLLFDTMPDVLPNTLELAWRLSPEELSDRMMEGAHRFIERKIEETRDSRSRNWNPRFDSLVSHEFSVEPNLTRFKKFIGLETDSNRYDNFNFGLADEIGEVGLQKYADIADPAFVCQTSGYSVYQVRWPVLPGVSGKGLLVQPRSRPKANMIVLPDADQTPEQLLGLQEGVPETSQIARRLAENGFQVLIPMLIDRSEIVFGEGNKQTHREWIYRQAFQMGRHIIGYEVQKVMAAVDCFKRSDEDLKIGIAGYCEGGLLAFYAAAVDKRIEAVMVSGYFNERSQVWDEPIYRNVWGLLTEFGDAEIASLIAPRPLVIEHSYLPETLIKSTAKPSNFDELSTSEYKGGLLTPQFSLLQVEFDRISDLVKDDFQPRALITDRNGVPLPFGSEASLNQLLNYMGLGDLQPISQTIPSDLRTDFEPSKRQRRQVKELEGHVQHLMSVSEQQRNQFFLYKAMPEFADRTWSTASYHPYFSPETFIEQGKYFRDYFWEEVIGKFSEPLMNPKARTRKIYEEERWSGYEVVLDVFSDLIAPGVLLIPKDLKVGERRPVVVVQHGRGGVPRIVIEGNTSYYNIAAKLADQGFIVYATYGLFRGEDRYRWLDRKANSIKKSLFSLIVAQHDQHLRWLGSLPFVDSARIAFYGKSYGGETAMRVPAVLEGYCLSICSADFGDWTRKVVNVNNQSTFMNTIEWEMPYFDMGSTFSYAELAYLIFPRPFMVERGHHDRVQPDEWVAAEYAKVRYLYDQFNMVDRTRIEFFNGGHASRNQGTFDFLHKFLNWP